MENTTTAENPGLIFTYAGFWPRLGAVLIDICILLPITLPIIYFNVTDWKSPTVMVLMSLAPLSYKPFFEFKFGATPGKMALDLRVVNLNHQKANLQEVLLRSTFHIATGILSFFVSWMVFRMPEFQEITGWMEYSQLASRSRFSTGQSFITLILTLVDIVFLASDDRCRTLHDRIGQTYVIKMS